MLLITNVAVITVCQNVPVAVKPKLSVVVQLNFVNKTKRLNISPGLKAWANIVTCFKNFI
ncbi:MAG: hypothetical protein CMI53_04160 [Parcubacteria group bacterium]|jgi:hypothetical protein|nr:hypothetical protein [Parcubacteria group bacterium]